MNKKEEEQEAQIQKLEAQGFCEILNEMYSVMLLPDRHQMLWEKLCDIREKYITILKKIE